MHKLMFIIHLNSKPLFLFWVADIVEMSCSQNTTLDIDIPVVMISKLGGEALNKSLSGGGKGNNELS